MSDSVFDKRSGFVRVTPLDKAGRRALWMKYQRRPAPYLRLRAGREGDDEEVTLVLGQVVTLELLEVLHSLLGRVRVDLGQAP